MDVQTVIDGAMKVKGKTNPRELLFLMDLATKAPVGPAVEVGALHGRSIMAWSIRRSGRGPVYVVDDECRDTLMRNLPEGVIVAKGLSWEQATYLPDLAFCFIDADHAEEPFSRDLAAYVPRIIPGGIIAFHDYEPDRFAVKELVDEWQEGANWEYLGLVGTLIAFRRPTDA